MTKDYLTVDGGDLEMASKTHWARGKNMMSHQCKTCEQLKRLYKEKLFLLISKTFVQMSQKSHEGTKVK